MGASTRKCEVLDCIKPVVAYGLCDMHRIRLREHGHLKSTRPPDWGKREKHPLYHTWVWMRKMRLKYSIHESWEDFWRFVSDVGERPSERHRLLRPDKTVGYSPKNFEWVLVKEDTDRAEYAREWRKKNPGLVKNNYLRKVYGITLEDYNTMHASQGGKCAICKGEESNGEALAVDHCHETGRIRGLLCRWCNKMLGLSKDSADVLFAAIQYLKNV